MTYHYSTCLGLAYNNIRYRTLIGVIGHYFTEFFLHVYDGIFNIYHTKYLVLYYSCCYAYKRLKDSTPE